VRRLRQNQERHCEERSDEAIQSAFATLDCFAFARNDNSTTTLMLQIPGSDRDKNRHRLKSLNGMAGWRANHRSLAAKAEHVAANWWQSATFCGFAARRSVRKNVSMEALKCVAQAITHASVEIRRLFNRLRSIRGRRAGRATRRST
jgi:hypothetical protein